MTSTELSLLYFLTSLVGMPSFLCIQGSLPLDGVYEDLELYKDTDKNCALRSKNQEWDCSISVDI